MDYSRLLAEAIQHPVPVLLLILGGILVVQVLYKSLSPVNGLFSRRCFRDGLKAGVTRSRLGKMLRKRNIELQYYLFSQDPVDIEKQQGNCKACKNTGLCDGYLDSRVKESDIELPFCRNNGTILKIRKQQDSLYILRNSNL